MIIFIIVSSAIIFCNDRLLLLSVKRQNGEDACELRFSRDRADVLARHVVILKPGADESEQTFGFCAIWTHTDRYSGRPQVKCLFLTVHLKL